MFFLGRIFRSISSVSRGYWGAQNSTKDWWNELWGGAEAIY